MAGVICVSRGRNGKGCLVVLLACQESGAEDPVAQIPSRQAMWDHQEGIDRVKKTVWLPEIVIDPLRRLTAVERALGIFDKDPPELFDQHALDNHPLDKWRQLRLCSRGLGCVEEACR